MGALRWRYLDAGGMVAGTSEPFADREAAEAWMAEAWQSLLEAGYAEVVLRDEERDRTIYRMGLSEG